MKTPATADDIETQRSRRYDYVAAHIIEDLCSIVVRIEGLPSNRHFSKARGDLIDASLRIAEGLGLMRADESSRRSGYTHKPSDD
jgi:hypothetical protein